MAQFSIARPRTRAELSRIVGDQGEAEAAGMSSDEQVVCADHLAQTSLSLRESWRNAEHALSGKSRTST